MRVQEFLRDKLYQQQQEEDTVPDVQMAQRHQSYSKLDSIKDIRDELDQPLQPHIEPSSVNKCSTLQAFGNTIKSFVGVGMLALPYGIKQSGLYSGIIGLIIIGFASCYTMKSLIRCKTEMELRKKFLNEANNHSSHPTVQDDSEISYGSIGRHIFGRPGLVLVNFAILSSQIGFCCAYILFIGNNLNTIWDNIDVRIYAVIFFPVFVILAWIRNMKYLAPISIFANLALVLAVVVVFYFGFTQMTLQRSYSFIHLAKFPLFFGIAVFGYEGINLAIPIQSSMRNPKAYPRMLDLSLLTVGTLYILFGALGYLFFGEATDPIITKNLTSTNGVVTVVKIALIVELTFSYPVQLFPVTSMIEFALDKYLQTHKNSKKNLIRMLVVAFTVGVSIGIPYFDLLMSLIGSFSNSMVVFIFPTLFLLAIFRGRLTWPEVVLNVGILVLGIIASAISSTFAIINIIQAFQDGGAPPDDLY